MALPILVLPTYLNVSSQMKYGLTTTVPMCIRPAPAHDRHNSCHGVEAYVLLPAADLVTFDSYISCCCDQILDKRPVCIIYWSHFYDQMSDKKRTDGGRFISANKLMAYEGRCLESGSLAFQQLVRKQRPCTRTISSLSM